MKPANWNSVDALCAAFTRRFAALLAVTAIALFALTISHFGTALAQTPAPAAPTPGPAATPPAAATPAVTPTTPAATPAATPPATPPVAAAPVVPAAPVLPPEVSEQITQLAKGMDAAEKSILEHKEAEDELGRVRSNVEALLNTSSQTAELLRPQYAEVKGQIDKLGPPPKDQTESAEIAALRARLTAQAAALDGAIKSAELSWVRARQSIEKITVMRHAIFARNLLERLPSPLLPGLWREVIADTPAVAKRMAYLGADWWSWAYPHRVALVLLFLAAALLFAALRRVIWRWTAQPETITGRQPAFFERAVAVSWIAPLRMLPWVATALLVYGGLDALDLLYTPWDRLGSAALKALLLYTATSTLAATALSPDNATWRLVPLGARSANRVHHLVQGIVGVYGLDIALTEMSRAFFLPLPLTVVQSFVASVAFAGLLVGLLRTPFQNVTEEGAPQRPVSLLAPRWLKIPLWVAAVVIIVASLLGYVALGRFVAQQLVMTGLVFSVAGLLYLAIHALTRKRRDGRHVIGDFLGQHFALDQPRQQQLSRLTEFMLVSGLAMVALPALMLQWGFQAADIRDWAKAALFGFEIGHIKISLIRILVGVALFTGLLFATRLFQRWLRENFLQPPRMDTGIANSIDLSVGYAGSILAGLLAVSYAGFDITSLAIVAGALSVGIGFGLQSIFNNFVSGLILLVERPIKVGDWVVVGADQGNVRRISVRATEIETFDRATLILPNSELITGRVINWTHRNALGRVRVKFSTDANADPDQVLALMLRCAKANPRIMKQPEPSVTLDSFSTAALEFTIRATVSDVTTGGGVQSELRLAILKALKAEGFLTIAAPVSGPIDIQAAPLVPGVGSAVVAAVASPVVLVAKG